MSGAEMVQRVRTLLNEIAEGFWKDSEIYASLTDGQLEYIKLTLDQFRLRQSINPTEPLPLTLQSICAITGDESASLNAFDVPVDFLYDISLKVSYGDKTESLFRRNAGADFFSGKLNSLMSQGYYYPKDGQFLLDIDLTGVELMTYEFQYLRVPDAIKPQAGLAPAVDPILPVITHNAIVRYAVSDMLRKEDGQRLTEAIENFNEFLSMFKYV